jgi:predicted permease
MERVRTFSERRPIVMWLDHGWRDLQYAVRRLMRTPAFSVIAVLTLALGIGANTAMFSIIYGILLRPMPYHDANRLLLIQREQDLSGAHRPVPALFLSPIDIRSWEERLHSFESTAVYSTQVAALATDQGTELLDSAVVSDRFFSTLAGPMAAGRPLGQADDLTPSVVISERLSHRLFGASPSAVGQPLILSSHAYTIVGVADSAFQFPSSKTDVWIPAGFMRSVNPRCCGFRMFGRVQANVRTTDAQTEVAALAKTVASSAPGPRTDIRVTVVSLRDQLVGSVRPALLILFAAVGLVLLVACTNVVNLLVARQVTMRRETAIRSALGASRTRLLGQSLIESTVLAACGAGVGVVLAIAIVRLVTRWQPPGVPRLDAVHMDVPVLLFSIALAAAAALATGLLPAWHSASTADTLKFAASKPNAPRGRRVRRVLCAAELAISLVLLIGATLLGRSLVRLMSTDLGVTTDHVVTASMNFAFGKRPSDAETVERVERVIERIRMLPGVRAVGVGTALPPSASRLRLTLRRTGEAVDYQAAGVAATPEYFEALGMRLVRGRLFTADDDLRHSPVMIMSIDTARRFFGDGDPIGRTMSLPVSRNGATGSEEMTLIGTIANVKYSGLDAAADDAVYRPFSQQTWVAPYLVVRTTSDPQDLVPTLGRAIGAVDRNVVVTDVRTLDSIIANAAAQPRFRTLLLCSIAGIAVLMAVVGLYAVVAYSVSQRTSEIGIRMALGAKSSDVLAMVLREGLLLAIAGIMAGLVAAIAATRTLTGLLYGVAPTDVLSFGVASASLLIVALLATYFPSASSHEGGSAGRAPPGIVAFHVQSRSDLNDLPSRHSHCRRAAGRPAASWHSRK